MSEVRHEQLELDFTEGEKEMEQNKVIDVEAVEVQEEQAPKAEDIVEAKAQVVVSLLSNGQLDVSIPEGMPQLQPIEIEQITRQVSEQLRDIRVATTAIEIFKQRLG